MIVIILYMILSFILDNFMSNIFCSTLTDISYFTTIYIIISIAIIFPYFINKKKFYILLCVFGLLFDILYTGSFILNMVLFFVVGLLVKILNNIFPENVFTSNMLSLASIICYHILSFLILSLVSSVTYDFVLLVNIILHSILMTVIYSTISYFGLKYVFNKFDIKLVK